MMKNLMQKAVPFLLLAPVLILAGCYTQVGGVKGEDTPDEQSYNNDEYVDSTGAGGQYAYEDYARYPYGMSYYYPPYHDPWFYGARPIYGYGYGYGYYDPIWWDYAPPYYYGSWYGGYYYPPAYGWAYGGGYYGSGHGTELKGYGTRRTIGNVRATGPTRGMESGYVPTSRGSGSAVSLPTGSARRTATPAAVPKTPTTRSGGSSGTAVDRSGSGRTSSTGSGTRSSTPQSRPSSGGSRGGSTRGGSGRSSSYTPPPPPPPPSSSAPSSGSDRGGSSGGSSSGGSSSGGSRSGGSRR